MNMAQPSNQAWDRKFTYTTRIASVCAQPWPYMHEPDVANVCTALVLVQHVFSQQTTCTYVLNFLWFYKVYIYANIINPMSIFTRLLQCKLPFPLWQSSKALCKYFNSDPCQIFQNPHHLKVHKHEIFFLNFFAETEALWSQGHVT